MVFWEDKRLEDMTQEEWESLCDGCGRCCLIKLEDEDTGEILSSDVHCRMLDAETCRCTDYANRKRHVPDCIKLNIDNVRTIGWIPTTCAYRRLAEGKGLSWWHPLVSGDLQTVIDAGISISGRTVAEGEISENQWEDHIATWPDRDPDC